MKVLVAVDEKPRSQAVLDALIKMHWYEFTEIVLLNVTPAGGDTPSQDGKGPTCAQEIESLSAELGASLRQCTVSFLALTGDPAAIILQTSEEIGAELIVLGSNCKSTMERLLLGSVCQSVLNGAKCPVIVAKTPCCLAREISPGFRNILVPVDNSIFSDIAVRWLSSFSWAAETRFIVTAAVPMDSDLVEVRKSLEQRAGDLSKWIQTQNIAVEIATGEPRDIIIAQAKKYYTDLIVMGAHGHTGLKELILGSVSHSVSHASPCAVAIVRGLAGDESELRSDGTYSKLKPAASASRPTSYRNEERGSDSVHVMPGGF